MPAKRGKPGVGDDSPGSQSSLSFAMNRLAVENDKLMITEEEREDNIRVIMYLIEKNSQTFVPSKGGCFVLNPQDSAQVAAVKLKMEQLKNKLEKNKVPFKVVQMTGITNFPVDACGGATPGFMCDVLPPRNMFDNVASDTSDDEPPTKKKKK